MRKKTIPKNNLNIEDTHIDILGFNPLSSNKNKESKTGETKANMKMKVIRKLNFDVIK